MFGVQVPAPPDFAKALQASHQIFDRDLMKKQTGSTLQKCLQMAGSLKLAIGLILTLASVCTYATFFEATYGTQAVQYSIYKTIWFGLLLLLIAMNVACAALKKYPWKHHQVGFLLTHLGILILIGGSFVSFTKGIDATVSLQNGESAAHYLCSEETLSIVHEASGASFSKTLEVGPYPRQDLLASFTLPNNTHVDIDRFYPYAAVHTQVVSDETAGGAAISIRLQNQFVNVTEWLYFDEPTHAQAMLGPAQIEFKKLNQKDLPYFLQTARAVKTLLGEVKLMTQDRVYTVKLHQTDLGKTLQIPGTSLRLKNIQYFPNAAVMDNKLVNRSPEPQNPAIKLELFGEKGIEKHVAFALFPQFPSTHEGQSLYAAKLEFISVSQYANQPRTLQVGLVDQKLYYRVNSSKGIRTGRVEIGKGTETGWMGLIFTVEKFYPQAFQKVSYRPIQVQNPNNPKVPSVVRYTFIRGEKFLHAWLLYGEKKSLMFEKEAYALSYQPKVEPLGFELELQKFEMGTDPGTDNPASYQSRVMLRDPSQHIAEPHLISMNEPLDYKGYTFYQSSYFKDEAGNPIGSVLSVGYDAGRNLKYGGSTLMVLGILLMFFFRNAYLEAYRKFQTKRGKHNA
ncbi:MAG: cytochrome c biogenesis protein ResB [Deltaproteobacteria bacterium]|nr:cytochrome c biogenesis protein ResB [Deltaproteobacteria bacterium]